MHRILGVLAVMGLVFAGCGGGGGVEGPDTIGGDTIADVADVGGDPGGDPGGNGRDPGQVDPDATPPDTTTPDTASPDVPVVACEIGVPCDDGDPCTRNDVCTQDRVCLGTPVDGCDDGLDCTQDACPDEGDCTHTLLPGWCLVEDVCYRDGAVDIDNACRVCLTAVYTDRFVNDDLLPCDDGDACTSGDRCLDGACVGGGPACDDGNACTANLCQDGVCDHPPLDGTPCSDQDACTVDDVCVQGTCTGTPRSCDDGNACTDDACDPATGCTYVFNSAPCDDGNTCTVGDTCFRGACVPGEGRFDCDDDNPCTDDFCVPGEGCVHVANTVECSDGDPCTLGDRCKRGECVPGDGLMECDDGDVCTDDLCTPFVGCQFPFNSAPCDDGEFCTVGDFCDQGACVGGPGVANCDDGNPCTDDACTPGEGCTHTFNTAPCDDGNACTGSDTCQLGKCAGIDQSALCEDGLVCTIDSCSPATGCTRRIDNRPECRPQVVITYPPRGATLDGDRNVLVTGHVEYGLDGDLRFPQVLRINGTDVLPMPPMPGNPPVWAFTFPIKSAQGMNPIVVDVDDSLGQKDHVVQTYYYSTQWYPVDIDRPETSMIPDGLVLFLGPEVWDDNDTSDVDDIATIMTMYLAGMDLGAMITNPVDSGSYLGCSYHVNVTNIQYGAPTVDLTPVHGGLKMNARIPNFRANIAVVTPATLCPDFSGTVTATSITIDTTLLISLDPVTGEPKVTPTGSKVTINGLNVNLSGVWGFLLNWLINFFEGTFAGMIEDAFVDQINEIAPALEDALAGLALNQDFEIPAFIGDGPPTTLSLRTRLSRLDFTPAGGTVGMAATIVTPKGTLHNPLGSIGRAACLSGVPEAMPGFPVGSPTPTPPALELGLMDDLVNLIPYALYWSGALTLPIPQEMLGEDLGAYGITEMALNLDMLLPPILSGCNDDGALTIQVGDIGVQANMKLFGVPVQMQMYASFEADAEILVVDGEAGKELSIAVREPTFVDIEIASLSGGLVGAEDVLGSLIRDTLMPELLGALTGDSLGSFPIPEFDLSGLMEGLPPGTSISIEIREVLRRAAYTVLSGNVN